MNPNDEVDGGIVVASGFEPHPGCESAAIVLMPTTPYYRIIEVNEAGAITFRLAFDNIVPAARAFHERYGFWGADPEEAADG